MEKKRKKLPKKIIAVVVVAAVAVSAAAAVYFAGTGGKKAEEEQALLREYPVTRGDITAGIDGNGSLTVEKSAQNFIAPAAIEQIYVQAGQIVKKGDKLAKISEKSLEDQLAELKNAVEKARIGLDGALNGKKSAALNVQKEAAGNVGAGKSEYESQRVQAQATVDSARQKMDSLSAEAAALQSQVDAMPEEDPQKPALRQALEAKQAELKTAQGELASATAAVGAIDSARDQQVNKQKQASGIDKQIQGLSQKDLDNAVRMAQMEVEKAEEALAKAEGMKRDPYLYASEGGTVMNVGYTPGATTKPEIPVAEISTLKKVSAEVLVAQSDVGGIQAGQQVQIDLEAYPEKKFTGKVKLRELTPVKDSNPVTYRVVVELDPVSDELLEGMTGSMQFIIKQAKDVVQLSNKAIYQKDGKQYVKLKNEDGTLREQEIATGFSDGKYSEIKNGLQEGDTVVVEG